MDGGDAEKASEDRAKIFAPFAALRGHSERLSEEDVKLTRSNRIELSEDEAQMLSDKLSLIKKGMNVTMTYFQADKVDGDFGHYVTTTGVVTKMDFVYRVMKMDVGNAKDLVIGFEDILDVSGEEIVDMMIFE